jgi:hypothetical protein
MWPSPGMRGIGRFWRFPGRWLCRNGVRWCTRWRGLAVTIPAFSTEICTKLCTTGFCVSVSYRF